MAADPAIVAPAALPTASPAAGKLRGFFAWWRNELLAALPPAWRERLSGGASGAPIALLPDAWVTLASSEGRLREQARLPLGGMEPPAQAAALQKLVVENGGRVDRAILALAPGTFIVRTIELPAAAEEALQQVVGFELDRHTPFKAAQARFAAQVIGRSRDGANIRVQLIAAPREVVDDLLRRAEGLGVRAAVVVPWDSQSENLQARQFNLIPEELRAASGWSADAKLAAALGAVFVLLFFAALILPIWQKREEVIALLPRLHNAKVESEKVQKTRSELEQLVNDANFIQGRKHAQVPVSLLIEDLARTFPDSTWVSALELKSGKQREIVLTGETSSATKVLELMEQINYLKNPSFRSPLTKVPGQTAEKFVIAAEIKPRTLPAAIEDSAPTAPASAAAAPAPAPATPPSPAPAAAANAPAPAQPPAAAGTKPAPSGVPPVVPPPSKPEPGKGATVPPPAPQKTAEPVAPAKPGPAADAQKVKP